MSGRAHEIANWVLACLTALVWGSMYGVVFLRDPEGRRQLDLLIWRWRQRLRRGGPRPVPSRLLRPPAPVAPSRPTRAPPAIAGGRTAAARAVAVAERSCGSRSGEWTTCRCVIGC